MIITSRRGRGGLELVDPVAASLRATLRCEPLSMLAIERQAEIVRAVRAERLARAGTAAEPGPRHGLRRWAAGLLLAAATRLAPDVVEPRCRVEPVQG